MLGMKIPPSISLRAMTLVKNRYLVGFFLNICFLQNIWNLRRFVSVPLLARFGHSCWFYLLGLMGNSINASLPAWIGKSKQNLAVRRYYGVHQQCQTQIPRVFRQDRIPVCWTISHDDCPARKNFCWWCAAPLPKTCIMGTFVKKRAQSSTRTFHHFRLFSAWIHGDLCFKSRASRLKISLFFIEAWAYE